MNCQTCQDHLCELLYAGRGEPLDEGFADSLKEHLQHCADCAGELRELQAAQSWLDALDEVPDRGPETPASVRAPVKFYADVARLQRKANIWRVVACAVAALSLLLLVAWLSGAWLRGKNQVAPARQGPLDTASPAWAEDRQRLISRLEEQEKLLGLLSGDVKDAEDRQIDLILKLDARLTKLGKDADWQSLQVAALQRDIDQVRRFLTRSNNVARVDVP